MSIKIKNKAYTSEDIVFNTLNYFLLFILTIIILYPFINVLALAFNDSTDTMKGGIYIWPRVFTVENFTKILRDESIYRAMGISVARTVLGTSASLFCTMLLAYPLSRREFIFRKFVSRLTVFTLYFSGGIIPVYFLFKNMGLINNFLVYIAPALIYGFNVIIARSYIEGIPNSLVEAARIDGASEFNILFTVIYPLSKPIIATLLLFIAVGQWNSWFDTMLYASSNPKISTLQYELQKMLQSVQAQMGSQTVDHARGSTSGGSQITPAAMRSAMTVIAITPIIVVYPFVQKYFIHGITLGGVKG